MNEKQKNIVSGLLFLAIGIGMYIYADIANYPIRTRGDVGSAFVPKMICLLMVVLAVAKIVLIFVNPRISAEKEHSDNVNYKKGFAVIGVLAIYCIAFAEIGFLILTPLMLFLEMSLMMPTEKRNPKKFMYIAVFSLVSTIVIFAIFYYGLKLMLPAGILKQFL